MTCEPSEAYANIHFRTQRDTNKRDMMDSPITNNPDLANLKVSLPALLSAYAQVLERVKAQPIFVINQTRVLRGLHNHSNKIPKWLHKPVKLLLVSLLFVTRPIGVWWNGFM